MTTGTSNESSSRANLKDSEIVTYDDGGLVSNDLAIGRIDAVISSHFGGMKYVNVNKLPIKEVAPILTYQLSAAAMAMNQPLCAMQRQGARAARLFAVQQAFSPYRTASGFRRSSSTSSHCQTRQRRKTFRSSATVEGFDRCTSGLKYRQPSRKRGRARGIATVEAPGS